jgi:hypothetical protein
MSKKLALIVLAGFIALSSSTPAFAENETGNKVTGFFKRLFNYPGKAVTKTGEMTANTLNNTGEKVVSATGENVHAVATGDFSKTGDLIVDPVVGTAETTGQAVSETVQMPVKAAEENAAGTPAQQ